MKEEKVIRNDGEISEAYSEYCQAHGVPPLSDPSLDVVYMTHLRALGQTPHPTGSPVASPWSPAEPGERELGDWVLRARVLHNLAKRGKLSLSDEWVSVVEKVFPDAREDTREAIERAIAFAANVSTLKSNAQLPASERPTLREVMRPALGYGWFLDYRDVDCPRNPESYIRPDGEQPVRELPAGWDDDHSPAGAHAEHLAAALAPLPLRSTHG